MNKKLFGERGLQKLLVYLIERSTANDTSKIERYESNKAQKIGTEITYLTAPNIAARVRRVVIAMVTLPGMDSGGRNRDSQATMTKRPLKEKSRKLKQCQLFCLDG